MFQRMKLSVKLMIGFSLLALFTMSIMGTVTYLVSRKAIKELSRQDISDITGGVYNVLKMMYYQEKKALSTTKDAAQQLTAKATLNNAQKVTHTYVDIITKNKSEITLSAMTINGTLLSKNNGAAKALAANFKGKDVTIFQKTDQGLLQIATSVKSAGTQPLLLLNDMIQTKSVNQGIAYTGSMLIDIIDTGKLDKKIWYIALFVPIKQNGEVIGAIAISNPDTAEKFADVVSQKNIKIGTTGYVYIIDSQGTLGAHLAKKGVNIYNAQDQDKRYFIREICRNKSGIIYYPWKNPGMPVREKIVIYKYFKQLDWIVAAGSYLAEFEAPLNELLRWSFGIIIGSIIVFILVTFLIAGSITRPIFRVADGIKLGANQVTSASNQVSEASQTLAASASEQAASVEETAATLEELSASAMESKDFAKDASVLMNENVEQANKSLQLLAELTEKMAQIKADSDEIGNIIKTIDGIAFQTNLLALNAAIEAARAGEAGAGFAVVAEEVRTLAMNTTEAAGGTQKKLENIMDKVSWAAESVTSINNDFTQIVDTSSNIGEKNKALASVSEEQAQRLEQINIATSATEKVTQNVAATSEETAAAAEELSAQAETMRDLVQRLAQIINGAKTSLDEVVLTTKKTTPHPVPEKKEAAKQAQPKTQKPATQSADTKNPEQIIPLDDEDFSDF